MAGLHPLQVNQWEGIWPNIGDFKIELESVRGGGDERIAWGAATWTCVGFDELGHPFPRPGRATVIMERRNGIWLAAHTHFSLVPDTPHRTHGSGDPK